MRSTLLIAAALLAGCARSEPADQTSAQPNTPPPGQTVAGGNRPEDQVAAGAWEASAQGEAQAVAFRSSEGTVTFNIACDLRGGLLLQRPGLVARSNLALMQLRTGTQVRRLAVTTGSVEGQPQVEARVPYNDPLIASLMRFDEPIEVRYEGLAQLMLPPSPLVGELVRTCQRTTGGAPADGNATATAPQAATSPEQNVATP